MSTLRIAVVTETYPPEVNGVAGTAARFVAGLRERGHQIQVVRPRQSGADQGGDVLLRGLSIPRYPNLKVGLPARRRLQQLWSGRLPDVVHIVTEGPLGWSALAAAARLGLPVVSDFRTNFHSYSSHYGVGWLKKPILSYLRRFHNRTLCTVVPTAALRAELSALGFQRLRVIARGVDTQRFSPARRDDKLRARWGAGRYDPVFLYVGRLAAEKNLATVAAAFEAAHRVAPNAKLVLVGDGPARRSLAARLRGAVFVGMRTGEDLAAHYASGDVFLFPSLTETYGNVTLEAMASGLAVVAFDYAAAAEVIVQGESGVLAARPDCEQFVRYAASLACDLSRIHGLGERARQVAASRGWDQVVQQLEVVLAAAAASGQRLLEHDRAAEILELNLERAGLPVDLR